VLACIAFYRAAHNPASKLSCCAVLYHLSCALWLLLSLQTGWVTMGSMQSAILGYGVFQGLSAAKVISRQLSVAENVIVQTTAVATATMPLAAGLVGIIPALGLLTPEVCLSVCLPVSNHPLFTMEEMPDARHASSSFLRVSDTIHFLRRLASLVYSYC
jgi:hypothetical protein